MQVRIANIVTTILAGLAACLGILLVLPVLLMLAGAFWHQGHPSLVHLGAAFSDTARLQALFATSAAVAAGSVGIALALGIPAGFLCFRTNLPLRRAMIFACLLASCIPLYVTATCWMALFGTRLWLFNVCGVAWISGIAYAPLVTLITGIAFAGSDRDLEDVAALDTGKRGVFRHASLPAGAWGIAVAAIAVAILSLWDITVTDILMVRTFAEEVFTQFQLGAGPGNATAVSLPIMVLLAGLWLALIGFMGGRGEGTFWGKVQSPRLVELGKARFFFGALVAAVATLFFLVPLLALIRAVGHFGNLAVAWRTAEDELMGTLCLTPLAATITLCLAVPAAWTLVRGRHARWPILAGLIVLISVPAPIVGIGLIHLLNRDGVWGMLYDSQAGLVLAYVMRALPFAVLALWPALKGIPRETEDMAVLDGGGWLTRFRYVLFPEIWQAMTVAWFLSFILALTDMGASFLVAPPGRATLSTRFFTLIHYGVYPDAAGICLILMGIVGVAAAIMAGFLWPRLRCRTRG